MTAATDQQPLVLRTSQGGVVSLTLNRPDRFNPLSAAMIAALEGELDQLATDPTARVVVIAGAGRGFCAGHDLRELLEHTQDPAWQDRLFDDCSRLMLRLTELPQPVIARVHGVATAAGCQLVSMCDLAVATPEARFALPGVNIGVFCSTPAVGVARNIGRKRSMQLLLTGEPVDAATAAEWGLVNSVVSADRLDAEVARLAAAVVDRSASVVAAGKRAFYQQIDQPLAQAYAIASPVMGCHVTAPDGVEGITAFLAKRPPRWTGRQDVPAG